MHVRDSLPCTAHCHDLPRASPAMTTPVDLATWSAGNQACGSHTSCACACTWASTSACGPTPPLLLQHHPAFNNPLARSLQLHVPVPRRTIAKPAGCDSTCLAHSCCTPRNPRPISQGACGCCPLLPCRSIALHGCKGGHGAGLPASSHTVWTCTHTPRGWHGQGLVRLSPGSCACACACLRTSRPCCCTPRGHVLLHVLPSCCSFNGCPCGC